MNPARRLLLISITIATIVGGFISFHNLNIEENLDTTLPQVEAFKDVLPWLNQKKRDVVFAIDISQSNEDLYDAIEIADKLVEIIDQNADGLINGLSYQVDIDPDEYATFFYQHLPHYLQTSDYELIDSLLTQNVLNERLSSIRSKLLSPDGIGMKQWLIKDPLGLLPVVLSGVSGQVKSNQQNAQGLFLSSDGHTLFIKGSLTYNGTDNIKNEFLAKRLKVIRQDWIRENAKYPIDYFGLFLIANANALQIQEDIKLTLTIAIFFILGLLIYYYRKIVVLLTFLLPGLFGATMALSIIYLLQGGMSGLALGGSAVIFGIVADYSFHFFSHFKTNKNAIQTRNEIWIPLATSSITTIIAFLSLLFAQSKTLHDFGLFTALSLGGTLVFVLLFLPHILKPFQEQLQFSDTRKLDGILDKVKIQDARPNPIWLIIIIILTGVFAYLAPKIEFEGDLQKLNFYPEKLKAAETRLNNINPDSEVRLTMSTTGSQSIEMNHQLFIQLQNWQKQGVVKEINSIGGILIPETIQHQRIAKWNEYWNKNREQFLIDLEAAASLNGFRSNAFNAFENIIIKDYKSEDLTRLVNQSQTLSQLLITKSSNEGYITGVVCDKSVEGKVREHLASIDSITVLDGEGFISVLIAAVKSDFNFLLLFASITVLVTLFLIYGNIELTLISFLPMLISWVWILGISVLLGLKFNFINIIISTFIFGLGDDFSIFITDGLQQKYRSGKGILSHYKTGILLSSISTFIGTGVLLFAEHPALRSIAAISMLGIGIIVIVSFGVQPLLFRALIGRKAEQKKPPMSLYGILRSMLGFSIFISGSLLAVLMSFFIRILFFVNPERRKLWVHMILCRVADFQMIVMPYIKLRKSGFEHLDFSRPSILIANHSSFFDILQIIRQHPKVVLLVNKWVYHSPLFGAAVRYADYVPAFLPIDEQLPKIKSLVEQGYSIAVFPEGRRFTDGQIHRFHKGAFYIAEQLKIDITPFLIHGVDYCMPKGDFYNKTCITKLTVLPRISWDDDRFGKDYKTRSKEIRKFFEAAYFASRSESDMMDEPYYPIRASFQFKSPILYWYFRIKWKFEKNNYETYHQLIGPGNKKIYDLGCGYGYLSYFLGLRDRRRIIHGLDFDEDKIDAANHSFLKEDRLTFEIGNVADFQMHDADVILLADVLHYLTPDKQLQTLNNCVHALNDQGIIIIRDGISNNDAQHEWTKKSEHWSTEIIKFNKTEGDLHFFDMKFITNWAREQNMELNIIAQSSKSSNTILLLRKTN